MYSVGCQLFYFGTECNISSGIQQVVKKYCIDVCDHRE